MPIKLLLVLLLSHAALAHAESTQQLYSRLTGKILTQKNPLYSKLMNLSAQNQPGSAVDLIMEEDADFIDITTKDFATRMLNIDGDAYGMFNDMTATVMGVVRDDTDARELLTGDFIYAPSGRASSGMTHSVLNNDIYDKFTFSDFSTKKYIQKFSPQWKTNATASAGILTTRGWARIYYSAGTNRRAVVGTFNAFLCSPIDEWKKRGLPDFHIRRDIDRAPEGKPSTFQNTCRTCHAAMDGMAGAFAKLDFVKETLIFAPEVVGKYNQNITTYPDGYITDDESWVNYLTNTEGEGVHAFGEMVANQEGFKTCMARRVVKQVCYKDLKATDAMIKTLAASFEASGYKFKELFKKAVLSEDCSL